MQMGLYYSIHFYAGRATISYPREGQRIPFNRPCVPSGEPKPRLQTLGEVQNVLNPFARTCIATNYYINPPHKFKERQYIINFFGMLCFEIYIL